MLTSKSNSSMHLFVDGLISPKEYISDKECAKQFYKQSQILIQLSRLEEAMQYINQAIHLDPQFEDAYYLRGNIYRLEKNLDEALKNYEECVKLNTQQYFVYYNIGLILNEMNRKEDAVNNFDKSLQFKIKYETLINKGILCLELSRYEECIKLYDLAISLQPDCHIAYYSKGFTLFKLSKYEESIDNYNKALRLNPLLTNGFNNRGICIIVGLAVSLCKINKINEAIDNLNQGLKISKNDPVIIFNLTKLYRLTNKPEKYNELREIIKHVQPQWQELQIMEEIEKSLQEAKTELQFILASNENLFDQKFSDFKARLDMEYRNLWNYDLEFEKASSLFSYKDKEKIEQIVQESLNTEESIIKHQLLSLENRVYFQSLYWRLSNYIKVAQRMYSFSGSKRVQECIKDVNQSLKSLLPVELDRMLFENKKLKHQKTQSTISSFIVQSKGQDTHLKIIRDKLRKASKKVSATKPFTTSKSSDIQKSTYFSKNKSISEFNSQINNTAQTFIEYLPIKISENVINEINLSLGVTSLSDQKIGQILKVFANKTKNEQQLEVEIQMAVFQMTKSVSEIRSLNDNVENILKFEQMSNPNLSYISGQKWMIGIDDTIQVLKYFQEQYKALIDPQSSQLHFQIVASQNYAAKPKISSSNKSKEVERTQESCACLIF
ncbi:unnamed protein product (macronuclear) [Paramecium tetraurelia]|uniref:Uncharacterized protein n=1 Tax=Paramecium tetraurelia TaxID=5888 RepID=A0BQ34_PARTE|nr:uncharacterized protein GSPATT00005402001 [Paramecium tetraurelia]CAK60651.1 unnamed protein product [Paramecium tetraurelia]|eukprot:XP_001428049.1 hypothetical protein (macronuclear) [Paramecium tetraurelia strain d4-2]